ncbi:unnamed protein product [Rotaria magnacalcarata]|nr:unnamed protein product [Rotaria magnacalcarata]
MSDNNNNNNQLLPRIIIKFLPRTNFYSNEHRNIQQRSIGCNTELTCPINPLNNVLFEHTVNEPEEQRHLIEKIQYLIHQYLLQASRR